MPEARTIASILREHMPDDTHDGHVSPPKSAASVDRYKWLARPPAQHRRVRNGPRPANRAAAEVSLHHPLGARSSRPVPHAPPTPARSGHPVVCHAARNRAFRRSHLRRAASGAPANSMALGAPHRRRRCSLPFICKICRVRYRETGRIKGHV